MLIAGTIFMALPPVVIVLYILLNYFVPGKKSVCVIVLGDIGRSPRMQYHSLSFLKAGYSVDIVGYGGSEVQEGLKNDDQVCIHNLTEPPSLLKYMPRLLNYVLKTFWQSISLGLTLLFMPKCGFLLTQNPPCIPTLIVSLIVCYLRGSRLVIDWHNYGYTIMGMSQGYTSLLVKVAKWYERLFGRFAYSNICVTRAMQKDLQDNWTIKASVMYDRPPEMFQETQLTDKHSLYTRLAQKHDVFKARNGTTNKHATAFTLTTEKGDVEYIPDKPALVVSSTSWTEDEDFSVLLNALEMYEKKMQTGTKDLPKIVCVITGKGPMKEHFTSIIDGLHWHHVTFCLPWLTPDDYPLLLGSADLGVCLHKSSSGLDLPMKVVDMFGCKLPVCAINFNCLDELVKHNVNGLIFEDSEELSQNIQDLLTGFPHKSKKLESFRENLCVFQSTRWQQSWDQSVLPLFSDIDTQDKKDR